MTHAPRGGRRLFDSSLYDGLSPIGAMSFRDDLVNNALHAADEGNAKVLCCWTAPDSSLITGTPATYMSGDLEATSVWYRMATCGPYGLSVFADGTPYTLVVEVLAASSAASAVKVAVQVGQRVDVPTEIEYGSGLNSQEWTTSSTTPAWLTSVSGSNLVVPTIDAWRETARPTTDVPSGEPREIVQCEIYVHIFGYGTVAVAEPRVHGLLVREFVGV
jgi:hypothetical protein